jgi:hypothetical protein
MTVKLSRVPSWILKTFKQVITVIRIQDLKKSHKKLVNVVKNVRGPKNVNKKTLK